MGYNNRRLVKTTYLAKYEENGKVEECEMDRSCSTHGTEDECVESFVWIFIWLRLETGYGLLK